MPRYIDPKSIAGKPLPLDETTELLVVGAGPAGAAAARHAAALGLKVVLADENPVPAAAMADDIPLHFGQRFSPAARNRNAMLEAVVARDPAIAELYDAGVDVRLATCVWGLYANGPSVGWLPGTVAGLYDGERSSMLGCAAVIVAAGRRDMGLAFPGWDLPGVLGITAAQRLAERYGAFDARRVVVLGTAAETLVAAVALRAAGVEIAALVEAAPAPVGPAELLRALDGVPLFCSHAPRRAEGGLDGVSALAIAPRGARGDAERLLACDAVLIGVGAVPVVELLDALGCRMIHDRERAGHVPALDAMQQTSRPGIYAAGDGAGIWPAKSLDPAVAAAEGERAASAVAAALGRAAPPSGAAAAPDAPGFDLDAYRLDWVRATVIDAQGEPYVCQCEEVTAREIVELRPPRYLGWRDERRNSRTLRQMLGDAPPNPDQVKRLTRAGMGVCQGRRCREQVAALLALSSGAPLGDIPLASHRAPVRPLPLAAAAAAAEPAEMTRHWDVWFGMAPQYVPYWAAPPFYTATRPAPDDEPSGGK